ncbi:MAG TPA: hypothetical protein VMM92_01215, partial [Thermoanaerobaculia bacterium]|nr:hypothetical protein [Thermoanaerobaculia bacterium]
MSASQKRFFSGDTLRQALVQAANHFHLDPEEIAYRTLEKRHGFIKNRRKVMIEVDSEAPRRETPTAAAAPSPPAAALPALKLPPKAAAAPPV